MSHEVIEPATGKPMAEVELAAFSDVEVAVSKAKAAFPAWRAVSPADRARLLFRLADAVEEQLESLANTEARNAGHPITSARGEIGMVAATFRYMAGGVERHLGNTIPVPGGVSMTFREPMGVVGLITPWNFPLPIASWKLAPALAAGNCAILKPAELTPLSALELERIALEVGFPEGVFQVLVGPGATVGQRLVEHPEVAKVAFTGSTKVGAGIQKSAADTITRVTLELGGKSANVVFADADLEAAAAGVPGSVFDNAGQDCCARSRLLVQSSVLERFLELLEPNVKNLKVGDPLSEQTQMGPLISEAHRQKVASYTGPDSPIAFKGEAPEGDGFWFAPTVLCPIKPSHKAATEEIFGPVVAVIPFETEAEAIALANDSIYGLAGSIWSGDGGRALRVARAIDTGNISINSNSAVRVNTPFGGFKQSGFGRELGPNALEAYSEVKTVFFNTEEAK